MQLAIKFEGAVSGLRINRLDRITCKRMACPSPVAQFECRSSDEHMKLSSIFVHSRTRSPAYCCQLRSNWKKRSIFPLPKSTWQYCIITWLIRSRPLIQKPCEQPWCVHMAPSSISWLPLWNWPIKSRSVGKTTHGWECFVFSVYYPLQQAPFCLWVLAKCEQCCPVLRSRQFLPPPISQNVQILV